MGKIGGCETYVPCKKKDMGDHVSVNQMKWSKMSIFNTSCNRIGTKTMALFKLTRQWEGRKAISSFMASWRTLLATGQFPLLKVWVALFIMLFWRLCRRGLKRKYRRVAPKWWVAFGRVWFFSARFAGSGSHRTNATTSRASRTARCDRRGDVVLAS